MLTVLCLFKHNAFVTSMSQMAGIPSFLWLNKKQSVVLYSLSHFYVFICGQTLKLLPYLAHCEQCCIKHGSANISLNSCFHFLQIYPEIVLLDQMMILFLIFSGTSYYFSQWLNQYPFPPFPPVHNHSLFPASTRCS